MCALQRPTITSTRSLILGVLAPFAGVCFGGWMTYTESATLPGVLLVVVFVAPWIAEPVLRRWLSAQDVSPGPPPPSQSPPPPSEP